MPPNRFESEVESFLEGSHGDRTHIKRADHPRLHHYAGRYCEVCHTTRPPVAPVSSDPDHTVACWQPFTASTPDDPTRRDSALLAAGVA